MNADRFTPLQRLLHWLLAAAIIAMLFIGVFMVSTVAPASSALVAFHRPLGIAILALVLLRLAVRLRRGAPALPPDLPGWMAASARLSHVALYALMLAMPLIGWGMLSAGGYPITIWNGWNLPPILPADARVFTLLRNAHTALAYALFAIVLAHLGAALFHALVRRDGVFRSMAP